MYTKQKTVIQYRWKIPEAKYQEFEDKLEILSGGKKKKLSKNILSENDLDKIVDRALSKEKQTGDNTIIPQRQEKSFLKRMFNRK